jgi:hypothetical protein
VRPSFVNSDRCREFVTLRAEQLPLAEARNHPNCLVLPFNFELMRVSAQQTCKVIGLAITSGQTTNRGLPACRESHLAQGAQYSTFSFHTFRRTWEGHS